MGKWKGSQPTERLPSTIPPPRPTSSRSLPVTGPKNLQRKIYFTILFRLWSPGSCTCYPRGTAERGLGRGMGRQYLCHFKRQSPGG